ncbi:MAG TPA: transposase [Terriglobales bacterium]|nr:transposase [Terriglobales bacterium]
MIIPLRGHTSESTYFLTASTYCKQQLLQSERSALLLIDVLYHYREESKYLLHEFVIMPDHFHLLITPGSRVTIERAMQFIKGGYSFRANKELGLTGEKWQTSFHDRRVRDAVESQRYRTYIHENPVQRRLVGVAQHYPYSSANPKYILDAVPQWLRPMAGEQVSYFRG